MNATQKIRIVVRGQKEKIVEDREIKDWVKDRDDAIRGYDLGKFKSFYRKYQDPGFYGTELPSDHVIEIAMRKVVCASSKFSEEEKADAMEWLDEHGSKPLWGEEWTK